MTRVWTLPDAGLGNSSYLAEVGDGLALAVDPGRDPRPYLELAERHGLRIGFAAETHVHADFVSGGRELAGLGARLLAPAGAGLAFGYTQLRDEQEVDLGGLTFRALATAGHSPEHLSYLLLDGSDPVAVFTGGALISGGVARTDLGGPAEPATRAAYRSARTLLTLPDGLALYPTHGPGSFCSPGAPDESITTVGQARAANPLLAAPDEAGVTAAVSGEDAFTAAVLGGLGSYPAYFRRMPQINRRGAPRHGTTRPPLAALAPAHVAELAEGGATIVDARPVEAFAATHVPGSISNVLRPAFATWLGWLADPGRPLVVVLDAEQDRDELVEACLKVGFDNLAGELEGGIPAWQAAGHATASIPLIRAEEAPTVPGPQVLDVRQDGEWAEGHIPGSAHMELGAFAGSTGQTRTTGLPDGPVTLMCGHGERAMTGASLLAARGRGAATGVSVLRGGPGDWSKATGENLEHA